MAKFEREWTTEECADVIRRKVAGESDRAIGRVHGRSGTTVGRLLKQPDIAPILQAELARIDRVELERERQAAGALRREEQRKREAERKRNERAAKRAEAEGRPFEQLERIKRSRRPAPKTGKPRSKGPILAVIEEGPIQEGGARILYSRDRAVHLDDSITEEVWRDLPREPWPPALDVVHVETPTLKCGLRLWSDDPFDREDIDARADEIGAEVGSRARRSWSASTTRSQGRPSPSRSSPTPPASPAEDPSSRPLAELVGRRAR